MKIGFGIAGALTFVIGAPAAAQTPHTFNTTGNVSPTASITRTATGEVGATALQMKVTGWQSKQTSPANAINSASIAFYDGGLGVIGNGDNNGDNGYHQVDNAGGYTDFILLQFSRAVTLSSVILNSYKLGSDASPDNDLAFWNASSIAPVVWNANVNLAAYSTVPSLWTSADSSGSPCFTNCTRTLSGTGASTAWLISTAFLPANSDSRDDGFKISQIKVTEAIAAVPEPTTWAMMLIGLGAAGFAMRRGQGGRLPTVGCSGSV